MSVFLRHELLLGGGMLAGAAQVDIVTKVGPACFGGGGGGGGKGVGVGVGGGACWITQHRWTL
jgi:hypothetical protein